MLRVLSSTDVSVVIPVWGDYAGPALDEALESLQAQDIAARIIVVDNASDPPISDLPGAEVLRSSERITVGAARNLGLAQVASPYVLFWDADDVMLPGTLRFLRDRIAGTPEAVLVAASILEGDPPAPHRWPRRWTYPLTRLRRAFALGHCVWSLFPTTGSAIMRTEAARAAGYGDANSGEDWVLGISLVFRGRVVLEERPGRLYRRHPASRGHTRRAGRQLLRHAPAVRGSVRHAPAAPPGVKVLLPAIALFQTLAVVVVQPLAKTVRAVRPSNSSGP